MTNNEDFFAFSYSGSLIFSGLLISIIPGYIASLKNKSFWQWWLFSATFFTSLALVVIKAQAFSLLIYLLAIIPIISFLALSSRRIPVPALTLSKDKLFFLAILFVLLVFGIALYFYLLSPRWSFLGAIEKIYFVNLGVMILLACSGLASFLFIASERSKSEFVRGLLLTCLFALPIFFDSDRAYTLGHIPSRIIGKDLLLGPVINDLIRMPIAGIFVLLSICSGCTTIVILLNDKFSFLTRILSYFPFDDFSPPNIHFSRMPATPIFVVCVLYIIFFKVFYHPNEAWIFLIPLVLLCFGLPTLLFALAGIILSSMVIGISIHQKKHLYAFGIFLCGLLAIWKDLPTSFSPGLPVSLLVSYGTGSGLVALILWVISDLSDSHQVENL